LSTDESTTGKPEHRQARLDDGYIGDALPAIRRMEVVGGNRRNGGRCDLTTAGGSNVFFMKRALERYGTEFLAYFDSRIAIPTVDLDPWIYSLRAACAGCLALYVSFSLNLDGAHWALTTCYIVGSERQSGRILAKSFARIVGTLVGVMASFTLINAFAQERVLFILCFAAWLSICAYFSTYQRGHWAYAWVLSGYTTAIVGIPAALAPNQAFSVIMSRAENVIIGILCMGAVSMIVFPETVSRTLVQLVQATEVEMARLLTTCLSLESDYSGRNRSLKKLTANALSIENLRHGFAFEEIGAGFSRTNLRRYLLECLEVASSASNLDVQLVAIRRLMDSDRLPHLERALWRVREVVTASFRLSAERRNSIDCELIEREVKRLQRLACIPKSSGELAIDSAEELAGLIKVRQLVSSLRSFWQTRSVLFAETQPHNRPRLVAKLSAPMDEHFAAIAVLRICIAVGVGSIFWFATAWPAGDTFLIWVAIGACRCVIEPNPAKAAQASFRGMVIAAVPAYFITFYVVPAMDGFTMFVLVISPCLLIGVGIATSLRRAGEAVGAILLFGNGLAPENAMQYDVVAFFNGALATILGVGLACLAQSLVFPDNAHRRVLAATKRLMHWITASIGKGKLTGIEYVGATARALNDLLTVIDQLEKPESSKADRVINFYALGHEIINLQQVREDLTRTVTDYDQRLIRDIFSLLQDPSPSHLLVAKGASQKGYDSCLQALASVAPNSIAAEHIASSLASFAVIRHRLNQQQSIVEYTAENVWQPIKEKHHAA
jgi:uncharacterized membrane protein YccC